MATSPALQGEGRLVEVSLLDVPEELRVAVAEEIVRRAGLTEIDAMRWILAARSPREHRPILVPEKKLELVKKGRRPVGPTLPVWDW